MIVLAWMAPVNVLEYVMPDFHPADRDRDFCISREDAEACMRDWAAGRDGVLVGVPHDLRSQYAMRAAALAISHPEGAYFDDCVSPAPLNWLPKV